MALVHEKGGTSYLGSIFGQDAKIKPRNDGSGKTDIYFGGSNIAGDGYGHGHAVIDREGNVIYLRDSGRDHEEYLIDDRFSFDRTHNI
ncbi:MAG: hypothetical protein K6G49_03785 [Candidatus Saccharibacteria bacterium]|nr:hypothetical protein [Candidatus Saccharibacteria bacterium]